MTGELAVTNYGNRTITSAGYTFRTYYSDGEYPGWYMDIYDTDGAEVVVGRRLTTGSRNILAGLGDKFEREFLMPYLTRGKESSTDALGDFLRLLWGNGEESPVVYEDAMLVNNFDEWNQAL